MPAELDPTQADPSVTPARAARAIIRQAARASLATLLPDPAGWPFASMVIPAADMDCAPLLVLSDLAQHARNLATDSRASLLMEGVPEDGNRQATPRVTLVGRVVKTADAAARARYQARNPDGYLGMLADFHLYRFEIDEVHFIGGFARARRMEAAELLIPAPELGLAEAALLASLNSDPDNPVGRLAQQHGLAGEWQAVGLDAEGIDVKNEDGSARLLLGQSAFNVNKFNETIAAVLKNI